MSSLPSGIVAPHHRVATIPAHPLASRAGNTDPAGMGRA